MHQLSKYRLPIFLLAIVLFVLSLPAQYFTQKFQSPKAVAEAIKQDLRTWEEDFLKLTEDTALVNRLANKTYTKDDFSTLQSKPYEVLLCRDGQLQFWSDNEAIPPCDAWEKYKERGNLVHLKNGYYQFVRKEIELPSFPDRIQMASLQLIKYEYQEENKYLANTSSPYLAIPQEVIISAEKDIDNIDIEPVQLVSNNDRNALYITYQKNSLNARVSYVTIILQGISILLILILFYSLATKIAAQSKPFHGLLFLVASFGLILGLASYFKIPFHLQKLELFNSDQVLESNFLYSSLGSLLLLSFLFLWIAFFFYQKVAINISVKMIKQKQLVFMGSLWLVLLAALLMANILKDLLINFEVSFAVNNLIYLNIKTLAGIFTLSFLMAIFFLLCQRISEVISQLQLSNRQQLVGTLLVIAPYIAFALFKGAISHDWFVLVWFIVFLVVVKLLGFDSYKLDFRRLTFWVFFFVFFASYILHAFEGDKKYEEQKKYAKKVAIREDRLTEFLFTQTATNIIFDNIITSYFTDPLLQEKELVKRIKKKHLTGHFNKYDIQVKAFYREKGIPLTETGQNLNLSFYDNKIKHGGLNSQNNYLYLIPNNDRSSYSYLAKLPIFSQQASTPMGYLIIEMKQTSVQKANVYPELIMADRFRQSIDVSDYSYAIYENEKLESRTGDFAYEHELKNVFKQEEDDYFCVNHNKQTHLVYHPSENQTVIISSPHNEFFNFISLFSYLFVFVCISLLLIFVTYSLLKTKDRTAWIAEFLYSSLRKRINMAVLFIIILSFIIIGAVTTGYFSQHAADYHSERLKRKQKEVLSSINNALQRSEALRSSEDLEKNEGSQNGATKEEPNNALSKQSSEQLLEMARNISEVHAMDVNIYNTDGQLLCSSQPAIFENELISKQMDANAFHHLFKLARTSFVQNEKIGKLEYLATYSPITTSMGENNIIGYLNLPYFAKEKKLKNEISTFLVTLINVYILIFLGALSIALVVANSITNPLRMIGDNLRSMKLGSENKSLTWDGNDEIGQLVDQYNLMIQELDKSAKELKKAEREYAWQQMARQVAHEIKNPLTPMKLSIQHLQRAYRDGRENLDELTERVTRTLIEQIDTLSRIASEFSAFAKMPEPRNEVINLKDIVLNAANLYEESENVQIIKLLPKEDCYIFADRGQLIRVFNNLVKNAIQAIPYDREGLIVVKIVQSDDHFTVEVIDNGIGIGDEEREKVFAPNFTTKSSGMGLGLAMSKNIIETAKGKIWFESEVGEGTTFFIQLPVSSISEYSLT